MSETTLTPIAGEAQRLRDELSYRIKSKIDLDVWCSHNAASLDNLLRELIGHEAPAGNENPSQLCANCGHGDSAHFWDVRHRPRNDCHSCACLGFIPSTRAPSAGQSPAPEGDELIRVGPTFGPDCEYCEAQDDGYGAYQHKANCLSKVPEVSGAPELPSEITVAIDVYASEYKWQDLMQGDETRENWDRRCEKERAGVDAARSRLESLIAALVQERDALFAEIGGLNLKLLRWMNMEEAKQEEVFALHGQRESLRAALRRIAEARKNTSESHYVHKLLLAIEDAEKLCAEGK